MAVFVQGEESEALEEREGYGASHLQRGSELLRHNVETVSLVRRRRDGDKEFHGQEQHCYVRTAAPQGNAETDSLPRNHGQPVVDRLKVLGRGL